jgi:hypothetical protein
MLMNEIRVAADIGYKEGFKAGAASRDAEVADLTKQRDELLDVVKHLIDEAKLTSSQYELCRRAVNIHALR